MNKDDTEPLRRDFERAVYEQYYAKGDYPEDANACTGSICPKCSGCMYNELVDLVDGEHERWTCDDCGHSWVDDYIFVPDED